MRKPLSILAAALLIVPRLLSAYSATGFTINTGLILELYNVAQQNNHQITEWPADMNATVVQAIVHNDGADAQLCFQVVVTETNPACSNTLVWSPILRTRRVIKAGETASLSAADFEMDPSSSGGGSFCSALEDEIKSQFKDVSPDSLKKAVDMFLKRRFSICLVPVACGQSGNSVFSAVGSKACTSFTLFQPNPGAQASVGMLIYPHNNAVPNCDLNFLWAPAQFPGLTAADIYYTIEVREDMEEGEPFASVDVPAGQNYYQWSARDRALTPGKKYYWRLISKKLKSGATFGGPDGRGWNIQKWFICGGEMGESKCRYSLDDLDRYIQREASAEVRALLKGLKVKALRSGRFDDPDICKLLAKPHPVQINVIKQ